MSPPRSAPRSPGVVYAVATTALVVLLATFALTTRTLPPPTIAEFAPQAVEQITDSPNDPSAGVRGAGANAEDATDDIQPDINPPPIDFPCLRRCVGDPPRQLEDPQSPPCVPYWQGDNGGATWKGVTRDEVRVVIPHYDVNQAAGFHNILAGFFN